METKMMFETVEQIFDYIEENEVYDESINERFFFAYNILMNMRHAPMSAEENEVFNDLVERSKRIAINLREYQDVDVSDDETIFNEFGGFCALLSIVEDYEHHEIVVTEENAFGPLIYGHDSIVRFTAEVISHFRNEGKTDDEIREIFEGQLKSNNWAYLDIARRIFDKALKVCDEE